MHRAITHNEKLVKTLVAAGDPAMRLSLYLKERRSQPCNDRSLAVVICCAECGLHAAAITRAAVRPSHGGTGAASVCATAASLSKLHSRT